MCLPRSLVTACFLRNYGIAAVLVIAAQKNPFTGHAWVEVDEIVVNDEQSVKTEYDVLDRI